MADQTKKLEWCSSNWKSVATIITSIGVIVSTAWGVDNYFAKSVQLQTLALNFEQYKIEEQIDKTQARIWDTKDRLKASTRSTQDDLELLRRVRELEEQKIKLEKKLDKINSEIQK